MDTNLFAGNQLDSTVQEWLAAFNDHKLSALDIRKFWSIHVPNLFSIPINKNGLIHKFDRVQIQQILFNRLEQFICASSNPKEKFNSFMKNPKLCGRVFKSNEPIYTCRDCGVDSSCVRCVDCFKNSSHKNHRYKISMSNGGGLCDCGDTEAWKSDPYCDIHKESNGDIESTLDEGMRDRFELVVKTLVNYSYELLCWDNHFDLPKDLESKEALDLNYHATVLFNDEIHTFHQVISSLTRSILCDNKVAQDFSTLVDREGRAAVRVSTFEDCRKVKAVIERITSRSPSTVAIKCEVIQMNVMTHQEHALQLLDWLNTIITYHEGLRFVFGRVMQTNCLEVKNNKITHLNVNILNQIMTNDHNLWKTARNLWHKLFISGMLMNGESKKFFAKSFTKLYGQLMQDFIDDNHDHTYSIIHLSIQIYSVPSLAHSLIEEDDALFVISKSFHQECCKHLSGVGKNAKIQVRRELTNSFKRSQTVLNDLKYLLITTPANWTENLRKSFLHGFELIVIILKWMQDMDSITRQVGQHLETESEWELAIYLQLKMSSVVAQLYDWCSSDFKVLKRSISIALENLSDKMEPLNYKTWKLCDITCRCIDYDVSSQPVTIHLALSRAVSGLLLELSKHDFHYSSLDAPLNLIELLELPMRTLVMISQFRASMWRRNGFSLVNQILFYHGALFREEMYDKDIIMMQYVGSLVDADEYLIHLLNKFNLMHWIRSDYEIHQRKQEEDFIRQTSTLVEEFLNLLLIIVSERHTPGIGKVTIEDKIKKEIIQWLCIEPCTHSDLIKNLSRPTLSVPIETLINEVAVFKKHKDNQSGKYELKNEFYEEFNPFFYHYTRIDQCSAEESQLKRKKQNNEDFVCCHPPVPPELTDHFKPLRNILVSKIFMHLIKVVLTRVCDENFTSFSENQYEKIMHLIGVALHEERRDLDNKDIKDEDKFTFTHIAETTDFPQLLKSCELCSRVASHKNLTNWIQHKFKAIIEERNGKLRLSTDSKEREELTNSTLTNLESEPKTAKRNSSMAASLRQKIMAQMSVMQNKFIEKNSEYFQTKEEDEQSKQSNSNIENLMDNTQLTHANSDPIAIGSEQRGKFIESESFFCILCREREDLNVNSTSCMVLAAFAQRSTVLSKNRKRKISVSQRKKCSNQDQRLTTPADLYCGTHISTCGHVMHLECWEQYIQNIQTRERRRPIRYGRHGSFNVENNEYLCPLCECLSNTIIPLIPNLFYRETLRNSKSHKVKIGINDWLSVMFSLISTSKSICENYGSITKRKVKLEPLDKIIENLSLSEESMQAFKTLEEVYTENADKVKNFDRRLVESSLKKLSKSVGSVEAGRDLDDLDPRASLFTYWSCSFTMQSLEKLLREEYKPTFGDLSSRKHSCLQFLVRYCSLNSVVYDFNSIRNHCIDLLHYLLLNEKYNLNPSSILDVDAFSILISLILTSASLFIKEGKEESDKFKMRNCLTLPLGNVVDQYLVQLTVLFHMVQIILTQNDFYDQTPMEFDDSTTKESATNNENQSIAMFYVDILKVAGIKSALVNCRKISNSLADSIATMLRSKLLPFLRCTALFYHFLTEIMPPNKLTNDYLQQQDALSIEDLEEQEFVILCEYLALPKKLSELFSNVSLASLAQSWARHPRISLIFEQNEQKSSDLTSACALGLPSVEQEHHENTAYLPFKLIKQPHTINRLIDLPEDYTELINNIALLPCHSSDSYDSRSPTLCLVCGAMLCSNSFACLKDVDGENYGACSYHTIECGAGVGIYLRTNDCRILLLAGKSKGCFLPAPYVDEYGETDTGLRRGNPLHLCKASYKQLCLLWLRHGIQEQVARQMETSSNIETRDWHLY